MYFLSMMSQGKMHTPPARFTPSLRGHWSAPHSMPSDWPPTVFRFRVDEITFAEFAREMREDKKAT